MKTIRESVHYPSQCAEYFAANQALFNRVVAFYFEVLQAHEGVLDLTTKEALTTLETLTHATKKNPSPLLPLTEIAESIPAMFRRAAINAALGSARSFSSSLKKWRRRKEQATTKQGRKSAKKAFRERPPVPPRRWNKSVPLYAGMWWLHTPMEKTFPSPPKIAEQLTAAATRICAVDLNLDEHLAVCTVQSVEGTILATRFIGRGREIAGFRKHQLGRIARNRSRTGIIAENEQDNADLWRKIRTVDSQVAHQVSARIVQFATEQGAAILVFEHLGNLKPEKGTYSRRGNTKRAFWMKGRIFTYAKYKAWSQGLLTSRVNPRNTSRECHRCHAQVIRYSAGQAVEGYTLGAPLVLCQVCQMRGQADRNASLVIGQRLIERYAAPFKEKPHTAVRRAGRVE